MIGLNSVNKSEKSVLRIAVCDDYPDQMEIVMSLLNKYQTDRPCVDICPQGFYSGGKLLEYMESGEVFDLFLLDILMPGLNGIELAQKLREQHKDVPIVFMTSTADYALDAFRVSASHYILKPVVETEFFPVLDKIVSSLKRTDETFFLLRTPERIVKIPFSSIVCAELFERSIRVHLENGKTLLSKSIRIPFETAIAPLLQDNRFLHAHKSFVLNMAFVEELRPNLFIMKNGINVPVPRYKSSEAKAKYMSFLAEKGAVLMGGSGSSL